MDSVQTITTDNGYKAHIMLDSDPMNPREEFDHIGRMVCFHKRYTLGDNAKTLGWTPRSGDFDGWDEVKAYLEREEDAAVILPVFMYDHSGITISTSRFSCRWDSGQIGFIYLTKKALAEDFGGDVAKGEACLRAEVEEYDAYLRGDVYGYVVEGPDSLNLDSCWGFYDLDGAVEQAKAQLAYHDRQQRLPGV